MRCFFVLWTEFFVVFCFSYRIQELWVYNKKKLNLCSDFPRCKQKKTLQIRKFGNCHKILVSFVLSANFFSLFIFLFPFSSFSRSFLLFFLHSYILTVFKTQKETLYPGSILNLGNQTFLFISNFFCRFHFVFFSFFLPGHKNNKNLLAFQ